ncbi:MAG: hypothetical protein WBP55_11885 [Solirubrobacterales bacterium]
MTMTEIDRDLVTLHTLKIKGRAGEEEILTVVGGSPEELSATLASLSEQELVVERTGGRRPGWMLSPTGRAKHEELLAEGVSDEDRENLAEIYEGFLALNATVKEISSKWQAVSDDAERFELMEEMHEVHPDAAETLSNAGGIIDRFGRYGDRLGTALEMVEEDPRYMVSPAVDSYHTIWFEAHEDFLLTLGRTRQQEGSA